MAAKARKSKKAAKTTTTLSGSTPAQVPRKLAMSTGTMAMNRRVGGFVVPARRKRPSSKTASISSIFGKQAKARSK
jgi:hypothetical protein